MKRNQDISVTFEHLYLVHHNLPGKRRERATHPAHILFLPLQGEITITTPTENFSLGPGHMLYLPPHLAHSFKSSGPAGERVIAMIDPKIRSGMRMPGDPVLLPLSQLIKEILFYLLVHPKTTNSKSLVSVLVETLAECLSSSAQGARGLTDHLAGKSLDQRIRRVTGFLQRNLSQRISVEAVAREAGLSSRNLNRLMLKETGLTPKQFLITARIERAQDLLRAPGSSVTDVALAVGYSSLSQFIAAFRAQTGQLPSEALRIGRKPKT